MLVAAIIFGATLLGIIVLSRVGKEGDILPGLGMNNPDIMDFHTLTEVLRETLTLFLS